MSPLNLLEAADDGQLEAYAIFLVEKTTGTIAPLPTALRRGLIAITVCGTLSFVTTLSLLVYLSYMLVRWYIRPPPRQSATVSAMVSESSERATEKSGMPLTDVYLCPKAGGEEDGAADREGKASSLRERLRRDPPNQFLILIYNLVLADLQQAVGFTVSLAWLITDQAESGGQMCWMQGWFVSTGDLGSSLFTCAIAIHTYLAIIRDYRLPSWAFYLSIGLLWGFNYMTAVLGVIINHYRADPGGLYVRVMAWCWVNTAYSDLRLGLHYLWIFTSLGLTTSIYIYIFAYLHIHQNLLEKAGFRRVPGTETRQKGRRPGAVQALQSSSTLTPVTGSDGGATKLDYARPPSPSTFPQCHHRDQEGSIDHYYYHHQHRLHPAPTAAAAEPQGWRHQTFLLYPVIYVLCTAPLAIARARNMGIGDVPLVYFIFAGATITLGGFLDVLLYSWTRRAIVFSAGARPPSQDLGLVTFNFMRTPPGRKLGNVVYVSGGANVVAPVPPPTTMPAGDSREFLHAPAAAATAGSTTPTYCGSSSRSSSSREPRAGMPWEPRRILRQQKRRPRCREQHSPPHRGDHEGLSGMTIQCEIVTSVSVEVDPDVIEMSGLSVASKLPAEGEAGSSNAQV
ncbi:hypothetical protein MAPG_04272 [Magnaporthiopsis poae ATCC 64411]|uniref:Uncharacterized protein n=1 Tax=Magnaporthiopsis poae (strain ATCC 64411 / 73-15) TaxID=644358 RepID=A0A0C4DW98_MAGP6|nr:hypothetical protein MAPG_04272 [Magnaporthiopsis poae ATCC 64411]